jgi:hypothetical protein
MQAIPAAQSLLDTGVAVIDIDNDILLDARKAFRDMVFRVHEIESGLHTGKEKGQGGTRVLHCLGKDFSVEDEWIHDDNHHERQRLYTRFKSLDYVERAFLSRNLALFNYAEEISRSIVWALDCLSGCSVLPQLDQAVAKQKYHAHATLQSLYHPISHTTPKQLHKRDASFISIYFCDEDESVFKTNQAGHVLKQFLFPSGKALVFFGTQALAISSGSMRPLWYINQPHAGLPRFSHRYLCQIDTSSMQEVGVSCMNE